MAKKKTFTVGNRDYISRDATKPLTINVIEQDIKNAVPGDGYKCVLSQAVRRQYGWFDIVLFRTVAYVRRSERSIPLRYAVSASTRDALIAWDAFGRWRPIKVTLIPPRFAISLKKLRSETRRKTENAAQRKRYAQDRQAARNGRQHARRTYTRPDALTLLGVRNGQGVRPPGNGRTRDARHT